MPSAGEPRPCSVFEAEFSGYRFDFVFYAATRRTSTGCSYPCPGARDQNVAEILCTRHLLGNHPD
jgi:hypothetical protein